MRAISIQTLCWIVCIISIIPSAVLAEGISSEQAEGILRELKQIRILLEEHHKVTNARGADITEPTGLPERFGHTLGAKDAPIVLMEFTDYECTFCKQFHESTFEELKKTYIDTGKVLFISRDLPMGIHRNALFAAEAARCAGDQNKYWEFRDVLIQNANKLSNGTIMQFSQTMGLNQETFLNCLESHKYRPDIDKDVADAKSVNVAGTPTFLLGIRHAGRVEGRLIVGAQPYGVFDTKIRELLSSDSKK